MKGQAGTPAWVAPEHGRIVALHHLVHPLADVIGSAGHLGQLAAVEWVTGCRPPARVDDWHAVGPAGRAAWRDAAGQLVDGPRYATQPAPPQRRR